MYQHNYVSSPSPMHAFSSKVQFHNNNNNNIPSIVITIECRKIPVPHISSKAEEHFSYKGRCGVMRIEEFKRKSQLWLHVNSFGLLAIFTVS